MAEQTFLHEVAAQAHRQFGDELSQIAFVFPNKRPALYLRKWLGGIITKPTWSPPMMTIHEFILSSTSKLPADRLVQRFLLFDAYETVFRQANEPYNNRFEDFFGFSEILLNDFTELEANGAMISDVYANIRAMSELSAGLDYLTEEQQQYLERFWSTFSVHNLSKQQEKFIHLWQKLPEIYAFFQQKLDKAGLIDTGTAYRQLAAQQNDITDFDQAYTKVAFVGFNALNQSELALFKRYKENNRAIFYFDTDRHYLDDPLQEAGRFIRRNVSLFGNALEPRNSIKKGEPISIISVDGDAAQVALVPQLLDSIDLSHPEKSAILLADESQLLPLLHTLPPDLKVNITMGYELKRSVLYPLAVAWLQYQQSLEQYHRQSVYYVPLFQLLEHAWLQAHEPAVKLLQQLRKAGNLRIGADELLHTGDDFLQQLLQPADDLFAGLKYILEWWAQAAQKERQTEILRQLATAAWQQLNRLEGLLHGFRHRLSIPFVAETIQLMLFGLSVPLEGEPLEGVQIMGLLESRGLDFDHVILLQVNDGILPKRSAAPTFLPDSIRRAYQLSVLENQDSIFAYVFYRLLQRSQQRWLVYNSLITDQSTGEPSRFIAQLEYETELVLQRQQVTVPIRAYWKEPITIAKTPEVMALLKRFSNRQTKMTPSAFNTYLDCRLQFYFRYLAKIDEPDTFQTELDSKTVGTIFHETLEQLYQRWQRVQKDQLVTADAMVKMQSWLPEQLDKAFAVTLSGQSEKPYVFTGTSVILRKIIQHYIEKVLDTDRAYAPFQIISLEREVHLPVSLALSGNKLWMGGFIDRVDWKNGVHRIIDYKTGQDDRSIPSIDSLFDRENSKRNKAALQTFIYAWIYQGEEGRPMSIETGLYDVRAMAKKQTAFNWQFELKSGKATEKITFETFARIEKEIREKVVAVLEEIYDPAVPFDQTTLTEKCQHCAYRKLCGR